MASGLWFINKERNIKMKRLLLLVLIIPVMLFASEEGITETSWEGTFMIGLTADGVPISGEDNLPDPSGTDIDPDRELAGGWCTWRAQGLFFACWMSDVSAGVVSDTFLPGDALTHGFGVVPGAGAFYTTFDAFKSVGRPVDNPAIYYMELEAGDTFHLRTFFISATNDTFIYSFDTTFDSDPGTVQLVGPLGREMEDWVAYWAEPSNPAFYCYPIPMNVDEGQPDLLPEEYQLAQNSPNPFNSATEIQYGIPQDADVSVEVYNIQGHKIKTLVTEHQSAGYYTVKWDGTDDSRETVASGTYFYRIRAGEYEAKKRMLYIK